VQYSLVKRDPEGDIIPWAEAHGRLVLAYSPSPRASSRATTTRAAAPAGCVR
jgi:aryl-alcohol dehydrogenase-like predicted oxidoreductase